MKKKENSLYNMLTAFKRVWRYGYQAFMRDKGSSVATLVIMVLTISLLTSLFLFQGASVFLVQTLKDRVDISAYFSDFATEEDILLVRSALLQMPQVRDAQYVSKERAIEKFREAHKNDQVVLDSLDAVGINPLLASLNIRTREADQYGEVVEFLEQGEFAAFIQKVDFQNRQPVIERLSALVSGIQLFGVLLSIVLGLIAVLVTFNTVRLAIYSAKEEIEVMKLVGASHWFIRGPFIVEGVIAGAIASLIVLFLFLPFTLAVSSSLERLMPGFNLFQYFLSHFFTIFLFQLIVGIALGAISSLIAVRKYLKE